MYHSREYVQRALDAGAVGYVVKDAAGNELVELEKFKGDRAVHHTNP